MRHSLPSNDLTYYYHGGSIKLPPQGYKAIYPQNSTKHVKNPTAEVRQPTGPTGHPTHNGWEGLSHFETLLTTKGLTAKPPKHPTPEPRQPTHQKITPSQVVNRDFPAAVWVECAR